MGPKRKLPEDEPAAIPQPQKKPRTKKRPSKTTPATDPPAMGGDEAPSPENAQTRRDSSYLWELHRGRNRPSLADHVRPLDVRLGIMPAPKTKLVEVKGHGNNIESTFVPIEPVKLTEKEGNEMASILYNLAREVIDGKACNVDTAKFDELREEYYKTHAQVKIKAGYWYSPYQLKSLTLEDFGIPFEPAPEIESEHQPVEGKMSERARMANDVVIAMKKAGINTRGKRLSPEEVAAIMAAPGASRKRQLAPEPAQRPASNRRKKCPVPPARERIPRAVKMKAAKEKVVEKERKKKR